MKRCGDFAAFGAWPERDALNERADRFGGFAAFLRVL